MLTNRTNFRARSDLPLVVYTDASNKALGASLLQEVDQKFNLIAASSRSLKSAELNYSTIRRELLAVLFALRKFSKFLMGRNFIIRTDHQPLKGLLSKPLHTIENVKLRDMVSEILEFQFSVEYFPGKENVFDDYLNRNCMDELYSYPNFEKRENKHLFCI